MLEYLLLLFSLMRATLRDREALVAENLLLQHQLAALTRPTRKRPRLGAGDKLFWAVARALCRDWRRHLVVVRPESLIRWYGQVWCLFWRWRSRGPIGRPRLSAEVHELIATMAHDNPRWGSERIRGELLKPGIAVSKRSIQRYRRRGPAQPSSQTRRIGIDAIAAPIASPRANAVIERFIGTLRRECLDHLIILDEQHLRSVLTEYVVYSNLERPHRTLHLEAPVPALRSVKGSVRSRPVLGGLHHVYERAA